METIHDQRALLGDEKRIVMKKALLGLVCALFLSEGVAMAAEEPEFAAVSIEGDFDIRDYPALVVATVTVSGSRDEAANAGFRLLAGYIFGGNTRRQRVAMTAPVVQERATSERIPMTAPVTQTAAPGGFLVQFALPKGVTVASAPEPLDARVQLREVVPAQVAVIRFSGFWSESNYAGNLAKLQAALRAADLAWTGEPVYARYNAPFTPWFMRRNEIWLYLAQAR